MGWKEFTPRWTMTQRRIMSVFGFDHDGDGTTILNHDKVVRPSLVFWSKDDIRFKRYSCNCLCICFGMDLNPELDSEDPWFRHGPYFSGMRLGYLTGKQTYLTSPILFETIKGLLYISICKSLTGLSGSKCSKIPSKWFSSTGIHIASCFFACYLS